MCVYVPVVYTDTWLMSAAKIDDKRAVTLIVTENVLVTLSSTIYLFGLFVSTLLLQCCYFVSLAQISKMK